MQMWADEVDDQSYSWENVLPYYKKSPTVTSPNYVTRFANGTIWEDFDSYDNTLGGPLRISWQKFAQPFSSWIKEGTSNVGIPPRQGLVSGGLLGSAEAPATITGDTAERTTSQDFMEYAIANTEIQVYHRSMVKNIVWTGNNTASGVIVETFGETYQLNATKEVILSGGAFQSPQLLMVSGVGPRDTLESFNIPVVADLPGVGSNMWDHIVSGTTYRVNVDTASRMVFDHAYAEKAAIDYITNRTGPLTGATGMVAWEKFPDTMRSAFSNDTLTKLAKFPSDWPEVEFIPINAFMKYNLQSRTSDPADGYNYGTIAFALIAPSSRGKISIRSADMADPPAINPAYLTDPADQEAMVAAFNRSRQIWATIPNVTIGPEYFPGSNISTYDEILEYIQESLVFTYHASGTCKMGKTGDTNAVVDSKARVFGVNGLRVVDASSFPFLPAGHPQGTVYMFAEKIADEIKNGN